MLNLSNKNVKRKSNLESALIIIAIICAIMIPVIIWGDVN